MRSQIYRKVLITLLFISNVPLIGQQVQIETIEFKGNKYIPDGKLREAIISQTTPWYDFFLFWQEPELFKKKVFLEDLLRIEQLYRNEGYLDAIVKDYNLTYNQKDDEVDIVIFIEEGEPTIIRQVEFSFENESGLPFDSTSLINMVTLKGGKRYRMEDLRSDYDRITETFSNNGYPYIKARVKPNIDHKNKVVTLDWQIEAGKYCEFGEIEIKGNPSVDDEVIRRGMDFKQGETFSQSKLEKAQSRIYHLELFKYVSLQALNIQDRPTKIPILLEVKERESKSLEFGVGYGSEEAFRIKANWTHRNFLGGARILRARIKHATRILPLNVELELSQPFFFDDQNDLIFKPYFTWQDEKSYEAQRLGVEITFNRQLDSGTNVFISQRFSRDTVRVKNPSDTQETSTLYTKSILSAGLKRNTTDQLFTPTRGSIASIIVEEAGLLLHSLFSYYKMVAEYRIYQTVSPDWVLAARARAGIMNVLPGSETTPIEERYFSGGSYSVRGWERQELGPQRINPDTGERTPDGGNSLFEGSVELRYPIYKNLNGAVFIDFGNVWKAWNGFDLISLRYAPGLGIRYDTPIGPFRFDIAWKVNKQYSNEDNLQIHLSIGQAF